MSTKQEIYKSDKHLRANRHGAPAALSHTYIIYDTGKGTYIYIKMSPYLQQFD
jgi:hypothetical protein